MVVSSHVRLLVIYIIDDVIFKYTVDVAIRRHGRLWGISKGGPADNMWEMMGRVVEDFASNLAANIKESLAVYSAGGIDCNEERVKKSPEIFTRGCRAINAAVKSGLFVLPLGYGDCKPANFFFKRGSAGLELAAGIDFQFVKESLGEIDITSYFCCGVEMELRRRVLKDCLHLYWRTLIENGIPEEEYPYEMVVLRFTICTWTMGNFQSGMIFNLYQKTVKIEDKEKRAAGLSLIFKTLERMSTQLDDTCNINTFEKICERLHDCADKMNNGTNRMSAAAFLQHFHGLLPESLL